MNTVRDQILPLVKCDGIYWIGTIFAHATQNNYP